MDGGLRHQHPLVLQVRRPAERRIGHLARNEAHARNEGRRIQDLRLLARRRSAGPRLRHGHARGALEHGHLDIVPRLRLRHLAHHHRKVRAQVQARKLQLSRNLRTLDPQQQVLRGCELRSERDRSAAPDRDRDPVLLLEPLLPLHVLSGRKRFAHASAGVQRDLQRAPEGRAQDRAPLAAGLCPV